MADRFAARHPSQHQHYQHAMNEDIKQRPPLQRTPTFKQLNYLEKSSTMRIRRSRTTALCLVVAAAIQIVHGVAASIHKYDVHRHSRTDVRRKNVTAIRVRGGGRSNAIDNSTPIPSKSASKSTPYTTTGIFIPTNPTKSNQ